jgi:phage shock protein A
MNDRVEEMEIAQLQAAYAQLKAAYDALSAVNVQLTAQAGAVEAQIAQFRGKMDAIRNLVHDV